MRPAAVMTGRMLALLVLLNSSRACSGQQTPSNQPVVVAPHLLRFEGVDTESGIRYVRLLVTLPPVEGSVKTPPRFTMECTENGSKRDLSWFVTFGGVNDAGFIRPFRSAPTELFPPKNPNVQLKMTFEGYMKSKPFSRVWEMLPSGELRYRNPGMQSPNMDPPRSFLPYLNSLPGLRISYAKSSPENPPELFFQTRPLLDELKKIPLCGP